MQVRVAAKHRDFFLACQALEKKPRGGVQSAFNEGCMRQITIITSLIALCSIGCQKRTEIVIGVATDLLARGEIDYVQLQATPIRSGVPLRPVGPTEWDISAIRTRPENLPGSFGLFTDDGSSQLVQVDLFGYKGGAPPMGTLLAQRTSNVTLLSNQTLFMRMALVARCTTGLGGSTCPRDFTCVEGICRKTVVDNKSLPRYATAMENFISCKSGGGRVGMDTADRQLLHTETCGDPGGCTPMLGRPDSGGDGTRCGAGAECIEGTCYNKIDADLMCDVVTQAPCPAGQKCDLAGVTPVCRPTAIMPLGYASSCSDADPDLCAAGQDCQTGSLTSPGMVRLCRQFCMADSSCTARPAAGDPIGTPRCALAGPTGSGARLCSISCNPTGLTGCPAPYACQLFPHAMGVDADCGTSGAAGEGASCASSGDCTAGMGCTGTSSSTTRCRRFCRPSAPACPGGFTCQAVFSTMGVPSPNYGTCCPAGGC